MRVVPRFAREVGTTVGAMAAATQVLYSHDRRDAARHVCLDMVFTSSYSYMAFAPSS